jgi:hypothetical protein
MKTKNKGITKTTPAILPAAVTMASLACLTAQAQLDPTLLSEAVTKAKERIETITILGGDYGVTGGDYRNNDNQPNKVAISISKFGGAGDAGDVRPIGDSIFGWQPRLQGSMGTLSFKNEFHGSSPLAGDESDIDTFAIEFGGGARVWIGEHLSLAPTIMGMYAYTKNQYSYRSGAFDENAAKTGGAIDWDVNTWTLAPALNLQYVYTFKRTIFTLGSTYSYYHTESFTSTSDLMNIKGDSQTWMNKLDVDVPLGKMLWGHELRTGGYISRTEYYGNIRSGFGQDHMYDLHGRIVLDFLNQLWKVQWIGIGYSYLWGPNITGTTFGADIAFRF